MKSFIETGEEIKKHIEEIAEVAGYLWERGWAERNGGNISFNLTEFLTEEAKSYPVIKEVALYKAFPEIANNYFYVTGTGKRMRYVATAPMDNGCIIRINAEGNAYQIIADKDIEPTSEIPSHLSMHSFLLGKGVPNKVILHTHPTDLIAMTHSPLFMNSLTLSRTLWKMIPESRIVVPRGIGVVPYERPGSLELAEATIKELDKHDIVFWEKHGILAAGEDLIDCFDAIDTLSKSAQIYLNAKMFGYEPTGMTDQQIDDLVPAYNLPDFVE